MTIDDARGIRVGDSVCYEGRTTTILAVEREGIGAPYFRLAGVSDGATSYAIVQVARAATEGQA